MSLQNRINYGKKLIEKSREWHNHTPQPNSDAKRKRKRTESKLCRINKQMHEKHIDQLSSPGEVITMLNRTEKHENKPRLDMNRIAEKHTMPTLVLTALRWWFWCWCFLWYCGATPQSRYADNCIKMFILGGISSALLSEILFYGDASAVP